MSILLVGVGDGVRPDGETRAEDLNCIEPLSQSMYTEQPVCLLQARSLLSLGVMNTWLATRAAQRPTLSAKIDDVGGTFG
ncbi:MAG: hypothetical protein ACRD1T_08115 [Acidimicrobiia bacterium]